MNLSSTTKLLREVGLLTIALTLALVANFAYGQWNNPTGTPPSNNVAAPINVSTDYQYKAGNFGAVDVIAGNKMRSDFYCDFSGANCWNPASTTNPTGGSSSNVKIGWVSNSNDANVRQTITFDQPFDSTPFVIAALSNIWYTDNCRSDNLNAFVHTENVTASGFDIVLSGAATCGGAQRTIGASWIATDATGGATATYVPGPPSWQASDWGSCNATCGAGTESRTVTCRQDGVDVADSVCVDAGLGAKPAVSQSCSHWGGDCR